MADRKIKTHRRAIYPGSFDPITNGHLDILDRVRPFFDEVVVVVAGSSRKDPFFTPAERVELIRDVVSDRPGVKVDIWPKPDAVYAMMFNVYVGQDDLSAGTDVALVPQNVLIEETLARAMIERGDEMAPKPQPGETFIMRDLLAAAVAREAGHDDSDMDWMPD